MSLLKDRILFQTVMGIGEGRGISNLLDTPPGALWLAGLVFGPHLFCHVKETFDNCALTVYWLTDVQVSSIYSLSTISQTKRQIAGVNVTSFFSRMGCPPAIRANNVTCICSTAIPLKGQNQWETSTLIHVHLTLSAAHCAHGRYWLSRLRWKYTIRSLFK